MATDRAIVTLGAGGRIVLPQRVRKSMGLQTGDELVLSLEDDGVRLMTVRQAVRRAQKLVRRHVHGKRRLSKELLEDRRKDARRE